jgi:hypothetical protein
MLQKRICAPLLKLVIRPIQSQTNRNFSIAQKEIEKYSVHLNIHRRDNLEKSNAN